MDEAASEDEHRSETDPADERDDPSEGPRAETSSPPGSSPPAEPAGHPPSAEGRWHRLHTLSGALALGTFLALHLLTNASALGGAERFERVVGAIERSPVLPFLELLILVPLAFHAGFGVVLLSRRSAPEARIDRYDGRRAWVLQRVTAGVVLLFVVVHLWNFRLQRLFFGLSADALHTALAARLSSTRGGIPWLALFYLLGIGATAIHFANGLFAATAAWKIAAESSARRRMRSFTFALGGVLFLLGAGTVVCLATGTRLLPAAEAINPCGPVVPSAGAAP